MIGGAKQLDRNVMKASSNFQPSILELFDRKPRLWLIVAMLLGVDHVPNGRGKKCWSWTPFITGTGWWCRLSQTTGCNQIPSQMVESASIRIQCDSEVNRSQKSSRTCSMILNSTI